jgi:hypothetical protein
MNMGNNTPYANVMKESAVYGLGGAVDQMFFSNLVVQK